MENRSRIRSDGRSGESSGSRHVEALPKNLGHLANEETANIVILAEAAKNKGGGVGSEIGEGKVKASSDDEVESGQRSGKQSMHGVGQVAHPQGFQAWSAFLARDRRGREGGDHAKGHWARNCPMKRQQGRGQQQGEREVNPSAALRDEAEGSPAGSSTIKEKEREEDGFVMVGRKKQGLHTGSERVQGEKVTTSNSFQLLEKRSDVPDEMEEQRMRDVEKALLELGQNSGLEVRRKEVSGEAKNKGGEGERRRKALTKERGGTAQEPQASERSKNGSGMEDVIMGMEDVLQELEKVSANKDHKEVDEQELPKGKGNTEKKLELGHEVSFQGGEMWSPQGRVPKMRSKGGKGSGWKEKGADPVHVQADKRRALGVLDGNGCRRSVRKESDVSSTDETGRERKLRDEGLGQVRQVLAVMAEQGGERQGKENRRTRK
ncbi:hypothetical protein R1sor_001969 [Riccia sorocarpa]|uniref:Uncharacterized protein n=1 Tax=Riccia sorocarpa TaxID=122646 RepID=A0ABD3H0K5_9MARC